MTNRVALICCTLALALGLVSLPLHVGRLAIYVGGTNFLAGGLFGLMLAWVTRVRRPILIYLFLGLACLCLWPLFASWPPLSLFDVPSEVAWHYFSVLRPCVFVLGMPFPFTRWGQHGPDPLPLCSQDMPQNAETES